MSEFGRTVAGNGTRGTDFRDVFSEVLTSHLGVQDLRAVFPGHAWSPARRLGLI